MKIIKPSVEIIDNLNGEEILKKIECCGRVCYKSEDKITIDSAEKFVTMILKNGHESVLEHVSISVRFITDRGISHEIVRHRLASYSQESTRYCKYDDVEICMSNDDNLVSMVDAFAEISRAYKHMITSGIKPQAARAILPTCLKTEIIMTANLREWRHFLKLRTSKAAHPDMRVVAVDLLDQFKLQIPVIFDDIEVIK